jgi:hypothetical protein
MIGGCRKGTNNHQSSRHSIHLAAYRNLTLAQFGAIADHLKCLTERLATVLQRLTLSQQTLKLINSRRLVIVTDKTSIYSER